MASYDDTCGETKESTDVPSTNSFEEEMKIARERFKAEKSLKYVEDDSTSGIHFNSKAIVSTKKGSCNDVINMEKSIMEDSDVDEMKTSKEGFKIRKSKRLKALEDVRRANFFSDDSSSSSSPVHKDDIVSLTLNGQSADVPPYPEVVVVDNNKDSDSLLTNCFI